MDGCWSHTLVSVGGWGLLIGGGHRPAKRNNTLQGAPDEVANKPNTIPTGRYTQGCLPSIPQAHPPQMPPAPASIPSIHTCVHTCTLRTLHVHCLLLVPRAEDERLERHFVDGWMAAAARLLLLALPTTAALMPVLDEQCVGVGERVSQGMHGNVGPSSSSSLCVSVVGFDCIPPPPPATPPTDDDRGRSKCSIRFASHIDRSKTRAVCDVLCI